MNPQRIGANQIQPLPVASPHMAKAQTIQSRLFAAGLFMVSIGGTFAIFGCVPLMARFISPISPRTVPAQVQAFPDLRASSEALPSKQAASRNQLSRATLSSNRTPTVLPSRSSL
ncbi:hypothetical protein [Thermocoleostomius sinensis]|uniref:Uncharacterized protein n=1 Tax=Thermocoleostomius sinensis A174 TaxID=2016057 RepID=A0A9E8ZCW8_9CYAN|nr:hypothetical protein [Thermocoleostomius sinensis]WAL60954.1 hypothetical protein OXH18_02850 [Thermocoleostomius sinensis A174]